jgi:HEAT repeat protein
MRRRWFAATLAVTGLPLLRAQADHSQEQPGRALTPAELVQALSDPARRCAAAVALLRLGEPAAAAIAPLLADPAPADGEGYRARETAIEVLYHLGPAALPAVDALFACLKHKECQGLLARGLQVIGHCVPWHPERRAAVDEALGMLWLRMDAGGPTIRLWDVMSRLQLDATAGLPTLLEALSHENNYVRQLAAEAVERLARQGLEGARQSAIDALRAALAETPPMVFHVTGRWGNNAGVDRIARCDNREAVKVALSRALVAIDPTLPDTLLGHRDLLSHLDPRIRQETVRALALLGEKGGDVTRPLLYALDDPEPAVAREAATALGLVGNDDEAVRSGLRVAANGADAQLAARAKAALQQLDRTVRR